MNDKPMTDGKTSAENTSATPALAGLSCHGGKEELQKAAAAAGKSEILNRYAEDYPLGPHDQPQSMCPAFGSLRVGLRMRRTATILSGSACCVYGLTFTSHFYGARRSVGYVPFNSETLVTGKLFEDIRDAVFKLADPEHYDTIVITNLCVPTASGVPLQLLPKEINGVRIIGIDVPGFGVPTHAEAKDILSGAMLKYAANEIRQGPVAAPRAGKTKLPTITLLGEMFPADPVVIGRLLEPMGLAVGPVVPVREWRELFAAFDCAAVAAIHPFYTASIREFESAGRKVVGSAPVGHDGTAEWLSAIGQAAGVSAEKIAAAQHAILPAFVARFQQSPSKAASRFRDMKALNCLLRVCLLRVARTCLMSAQHARKHNGRTQIVTGSNHVASRSIIVRHLKMMLRRFFISNPILQSAQRPLCRRPKSFQFRLSISPISFQHGL